MRVIAATEIHGTALPDKALKAALGAYLKTPPRRVDRLSLQALLAAAPLRDQVTANSGLYIAAHYPARPNMFALLDSVCLQHKLPKPFEFVNSVSNAAGFQVAQQLGIEGPNLFIGAGAQVWRHLIDLAAVDFAARAIDQALLIVCDEDDTGFVAQAILTSAAQDGRLAEDFAGLSQAVPVTRVDLTPA